MLVKGCCYLVPPTPQSTEGAVLHSWEGVRVQAIATHPDTNEAIAADSHHRVRSYNFQEPRVTPL